MEILSKENKFKNNPRKINAKQKALLKEHINELGDLSGVVYCINHKQFVGGNQRSEIFDQCQIEIVERYKKPTPQKTVAHGFIIYNNEKYAYREVKFTEEEFKKGCIVANNDGGENDWEVLKTEEWDIGKLAEWGLDVSNFNIEDNENNY